MSDEVLSQAEVESLLSAMVSSGDAAAEQTATSAAPEISIESVAPNITTQAKIAQRKRRTEKVNPYDFKRPERVGKEQMRALQTLHEGFSRNFAAGLSAMLRSMVEVKLTSVDQLTYSEFVFSLENPTCFNLLKAEPLEGSLILDMSPSVLYPLIDRLLGGGREGSVLARRPLTEIELRLVNRITTLFIKELQSAWENVLPLEITVERVESNPQLVQIVPPNEVVVLISFELTLGDIRGMFNLCIPFNSLEQVSGNLSANSWISYGRPKATTESVQKLSSAIQSSLVEMNVQLAKTRITTSELIGLRVGDIITTNHDTRQPLLVTVESYAKFQARPGEYKGHKAICIEGTLETPPPDTLPFAM